jgi:hypothetical protein
MARHLAVPGAHRLDPPPGEVLGEPATPANPDLGIGEVLTRDEAPRGQSRHDVQAVGVHRLTEVPGEAVADRRATVGVPNLITIQFLPGRESRVEIGRRECDLDDGNGARQQGVEPAPKTDEGNVRVGIDVGHLTEGVDPGIGASSAFDHRTLSGHLGERLFERRLNRRSVGLSLPADELGAVVLDDQA